MMSTYQVRRACQYEQVPRESQAWSSSPGRTRADFGTLVIKISSVSIVIKNKNNVHGGAHGKNNWIETPIMFMYPKLLEKTFTVPGAPQTKSAAAVRKGPAKWMIPYGNHAKTSRTAFCCADKMLLRFAPYMMFSSAGRTRTQICGRISAGINLLRVRCWHVTRWGETN